VITVSPGTDKTSTSDQPIGYLSKIYSGLRGLRSPAVTVPSREYLQLAAVLEVDHRDEDAGPGAVVVLVVLGFV
jgi:hypothetical protein